MADEATLIRLCDIALVPRGTVKRVIVAARPPLAVYNLNDKFFITDDTCTHGRASLAEGVIEAETIECPLHGGCFSILTGDPVAFPATVPIRTYPAHIIGDQIFVELTKGE